MEHTPDQDDGPVLDNLVATLQVGKKNFIEDSEKGIKIFAAGSPESEEAKSDKKFRSEPRTIQGKEYVVFKQIPD